MTADARALEYLTDKGNNPQGCDGVKNEISMGAARIDLDWLRETLGKSHQVDEYLLAVALLAGDSLSAALARVESLQTSRIGADAFLKANNDLDSLAFYQGVSFALARVRQAIKGDPR